MKNREEFSFRNIIRRIVVDDNGKAPTIFVSVRGKLSYTMIFNKIFKTDLYNGCGHYASEKISTSLFNRNSNYLDNDGHIRFEQKIALIEFKEAMKDNIDKWVEHLKKIIKNRQGSGWHINIKDNMDVFEMIEFASCEWYEKNKLVYLINKLKSSNSTLAEALLYLLIVSLFPVCKDEKELYKDNPITNKKTVSAKMKESMSMKPFLELLEERHKILLISYVPVFDLQYLIFTIGNVLKVDNSMIIKLVFIDYNKMNNNGDEFKYSKSGSNIQKMLTEYKWEDLTENPLNCKIPDIREYYNNKFGKYGARSQFSVEDCSYICKEIKELSGNDNATDEDIAYKLKEILDTILDKWLRLDCPIKTKVKKLKTNIDSIDFLYCDISELKLRLANYFLKTVAACIQINGDPTATISFDLYDKLPANKKYIDSGFDKIRRYIENDKDLNDDSLQTELKDYIDYLNQLSRNLLNGTYEFLSFFNSVANSFTSAVNNKYIQEKIIFKDSEIYTPIFNAYEKIYDYYDFEVRNKINQRYIVHPENDLLLSHIAYDYYQKYSQNKKAVLEFSMVNRNNVKTKFRLRPASENDLEVLIKINSPSSPFSRKIFIRSEENELEYGIDNGFIWVIEDVSDGENILVCEAIIIPNITKDKTELCDYYQTSKLVIDWMEKKEIDESSSFSIYDAVIVNPGESGMTYRGLGFQRLTLKLCYYLSKDSSNFIAATVSPSNLYSHRNFEISNYEVMSKTYYTFNDESPYYKQYIEKHKEEYIASIDEITKSYLKENRISYDDYISEKVAVRDFLVYEIK